MLNVISVSQSSFLNEKYLVESLKIVPVNVDVKLKSNWGISIKFSYLIQKLPFLKQQC